MSRKGRRRDVARSTAFSVMRAINGQGAYANLELAKQRAPLSSGDAAFVTELVSGTCRAMGSYDRVIVAASGRELRTLQPALVDLLRLGTHQLLGMRVPAHAAISTTVDLAALEVGERLVGVVNAILHKVAARDWAGWLTILGANEDNLGKIALANHHPRWIAEAFAEVLNVDELIAVLAADNVPPRPTLVARPGLSDVFELGAEPARYSPFGAYADNDPTNIPAVAHGRAGVQDEGSQLVTLALARVEAAQGPWLDLCAGPGGKTALLTGLARLTNSTVLAAELHPHRAQLVKYNVRAYPKADRPGIVVADGTRPAWQPESFGKVLADVPCTGLGALRRRPEARWRRSPHDLTELVGLQHRLLDSALAATKPGGVVAYVTCSPHPQETTDIVAAVRDRVDVIPAAPLLPEVPDAVRGDYLQLWPHRHGTDAMFLALLRRR